MNDKTIESIDRELARTRYLAYTPTGYAPYRSQSDSHWTTSIREDLVLIRRLWGGLITYGCTGPLELIPPIAADVGLERIILGVYDVGDEAELATAINLAQSHPELIRSVCLGNEGLLFGRYTLSQLEEAFRRFRFACPEVSCTTSEPIFAWGEMRLLEMVDYCAPIIHPWIHEIFAGRPALAAMWVIQAAQRLQILSEKPIFIKETGYPSDDTSYPESDQCVYWETLLREYGALTRHVHLAAFEAFDNPEKLYFSAQTKWDCLWGLFRADRSPKKVLGVFERHFLPGEIAVGKTFREPVSVVIAAKDRPQYLTQAIESVLQQARWIHRLIIVNDNSSTKDVETIGRQFSQYPKVEYLESRAPSSSGTARNAGLTRVESEFVCFLDDDDLFLDGKIPTQLKAFQQRPQASFIATAARVVGPSGEWLGYSGMPEYFPGAPLASMLAFCQIVHSSVMMRTEVIRSQEGYLECFKGEDWELWCRLLTAGKEIVYLPQALTVYRRHATNISNASYLKEATQNVLSRYLTLPPWKLLAPISHDPRSGNLVQAGLLILHGEYDRALSRLGDLSLPAARIARFICFRELGEYTRAYEQLETWAAKWDMLERVQLRLRVHKDKHRGRRIAVGSVSLLLEQRLLAEDILSTSCNADFVPDLRIYYPPNPTHLNIEEGTEDITTDLFFSRVSLTSC